jgi:hypothetical protein
MRTRGQPSAPKKGSVILSFLLRIAAITFPSKLHFKKKNVHPTNSAHHITSVVLVPKNHVADFTRILKQSTKDQQCED